MWLFLITNGSIYHPEAWLARAHMTNYSQLPITRTLANSNQNRFPVDFIHTFTVILPSVTQTHANSNLPLTQSNFHCPSGHFLYNFTLDNSNHICQDVTSQKIYSSTVEQNIEFIFKQPIILEVSPFRVRSSDCINLC